MSSQEAAYCPGEVTLCRLDKSSLLDSVLDVVSSCLTALTSVHRHSEKRQAQTGIANRGGFRKGTVELPQIPCALSVSEASSR